MTNHYLFAFTGVENDADCTMAMELSTIIEVSINDSENKNKEFILRTLRRSYYFRSEPSIAQRWVDEINKINNITVK